MLRIAMVLQVRSYQAHIVMINCDAH